MKKRIKSITLTILTESPVALSNDIGSGNVTPVKKIKFRGEQHCITSVATFTYDLKRVLRENFGWEMSDLVVKSKNVYFDTKSIESETMKKFESDAFGYLIPSSQISKTSPLRIIPYMSVHSFNNVTQAITNRGYFNNDFGRKFYDEKGEEKTEIPTTQAFASEEIFGDYYYYTITIELDRIGVNEMKDGKILPQNERTYMNADLREKEVKDILNALTLLNRDIKHQRVFLKPLAVFGGAFENVIPYFWNDISIKSNKINLRNIENTIKSYDLKKEDLILSIDERFGDDSGYSTSPVLEIKKLIDEIYVGEDNYWYKGEN